MIPRLARALVLAVAAACVGGCPSQSWKLQDKVTELAWQIDRLLGRGSLPGRHLAAIRGVHDQKSWTFRKDAEHPLETTRAAVRGLASCDYATWGEAALVVEVLSEIADEHPSSLVRAEALDTLTRLGTWTLAAAVPAERSATEPELTEALKAFKEARGKDDSDPSLTFRVADAVRTVAAYRFDAGAAATESPDLRSAARVWRAHLKSARGVLLVLVGRGLEGFQADPEVRDAMDRAQVSVSAQVVRLTLLAATLGDPADATRAAGVRDLAALRPPGGAAVLCRVLALDRDSAVRREAAQALAGFRAEEAVPALILALADDMPEVRGGAVRTLEALTGQTFGDDRAAWARWWQQRTSSGASSSTSLDAGAAR